MEYYLFVTNNCNLDCRYCCGQGVTKDTDVATRPSYTLAQLARFIEDTERQFDSRDALVIFYGGEPTLNYSYIAETIDYLDASLSRPCKFTLHTNGLLLDSAPRALLKRLNLIIVSINYEKIPKSGLVSSYFSTVIDGVRRIRHSEPLPFMARLTITEECSLFTNVMQVSSFFDYVHWQIENCVAFRSFPDFRRSYHYELELLLDNWYRYFLAGQLLHYVPFVSMLAEIVQPTNLQMPCGYHARMVNIQSDGECFSCPESTSGTGFGIGTIYDGIQFGKDGITPASVCKTCDYLSLCRGRCGRMHRVLSEDHVKEYCSLNGPMFAFFSMNREQILRTISEHPEYLGEIADPNYVYTERVP